MTMSETVHIGEGSCSLERRGGAGRTCSARALDAWAEHVLTNKAGQCERPLDTAMFIVVGADGTLIRNRPPK
jgi:hypothetical protein